jgi:hypothetical protein
METPPIKRSELWQFFEYLRKELPQFEIPEGYKATLFKAELLFNIHENIYHVWLDNTIISLKLCGRTNSAGDSLGWENPIPILKIIHFTETEQNQYLPQSLEDAKLVIQYLFKP